MALFAAFTAGLLLSSASRAEIITLGSSLVWRSDGEGDYLFKGNGALKGVIINADGAVEYTQAPGTYELTSAYMAEGLVINISMSWKFTGEVTMEVSSTGSALDYMPIVNGSTVEIKSGFGKQLKWRAKLGPGSKLTEVRLHYSDVNGLAGSWGVPELSGFVFRKPIYIKGAGAELFHFQTPLTIGSSSKARDCDVQLKAVLQADFDDVRFTSSDGETLLPYYIESVSGELGERIAKFWVKIPQIPKDGLVIYLYYGKLGPELLSSAKETFEFYYDFKDNPFDENKWESAGLNERVIEYKQGDKITTPDKEIYDTIDKVIEFFKTGKDFQWARARSAASPMPAVDVVKTAALNEEIPNLPNFADTVVGPDGDLILASGAVSGKYASQAIFPVFNARIMVPSWQAVAPLNTSLTVDITAKNDIYKQGCESESYYYASRNDFGAGSVLRWRVNLTRQDKGDASLRLKEFGIDFRPGAISVLTPAANQQIMPGKNFKITWSAFEYEPSYEVKLEYSSDAGATFKPIADSVLNSGEYNWAVPKITADRCIVRVSDALAPQVYGESGKYFSITKQKAKPAQQEVLSAVEKEEEAPLTDEMKALEEDIKAQVAQEEPGEIRTYEILIKIGDNVSSNPLEDNRGSYKSGDIVMIVPAGHKWSDAERAGFLILQADLTQSQVREFMQPDEIVVGQDKTGREIKEIVARRKYRVGMLEQDFLKNRAKAQKALLKGKPLVLDISSVEDKSGEGVEE